MAQMIIDGLRPQIGRSAGFQDAGNDADVEEDYSSPRTRKGGGPRRRNQWENGLSVSFSPLLLSLSLHQTSGRSASVCASLLVRLTG